MRNVGFDFRPQSRLTRSIFDTKQHNGNLKHFLRDPIIGLRPTKIQCSSVYSALRTRRYTESPPRKKAGKIAMRCQILLKFGKLVHYWSAQAPHC